MLVFQKLSKREQNALKAKLMYIQGITFDLWATTHHSRFIVPTEFAQMPGVPTIIGDPSAQFCNEPAILVERILNYQRLHGCTSCVDPEVLQHYNTHRADTSDPVLFLKGLAAKLNCRVRLSDVELFNKIVKLEQEHLALYPDVHNHLPEIARQYPALSIASNLCQLSACNMMNIPVAEPSSGGSILYRVQPFGSFFRNKIFSFQEGSIKPDLFEQVERQTEIPLNLQLMIGDNPHADVLGSLNAGYRFAILIDRTMNPEKFAQLNLPDNAIYVSSLKEVRQLLPLCPAFKEVTF